jgi:hypothetical protein
MRQGALLIAPAFAARRRISPSACRHKKLLARRAAIEFLLHFFRATVDARESQSRDRAGSRQAAARVFLHQIFALVTPIFFQVVVDKVLTQKGYSTLYVLVAGLVLIGLFDAVLQYLRLTGQERADVLKLAHARDRLARSPRLK